MPQRPIGKPRNWLRAVALVACAALAGSAPAAVPEAGPPATAEPLAYRQIDPRAGVASHFTQVSAVSLAMVAVPDPRVPRHRRAYDLSVVALIQGMLDEGYVLDRYSFPWEESLRKADSDEPGNAQQTDDCKYGLMIFRRDTWRDMGDEGAPELRALYLVPETNTYGLPRGTMFAAMRDMAAQAVGKPASLPTPWCKPADAVTTTTVTANTATTTTTTTRTTLPAAGRPAPAAAAAATPGPAVVPGRTFLASHGNCTSMRRHFLMLGPTFSGSLDSLAQVAAEASAAELPPICAVSASATATSNVLVAGFPQPRPDALEFHSLAVQDDSKLVELWAMAGRLGALRPGKIAILSESSVFGHELCDQGRSRLASPNEEARNKLCRNAVRVSFPANIADVRAGLRARRSEQEGGLRRLMPQQRGLPLEDGAGNGSELPHSLQSRLTAAGSELELRKAIRMLAMLKPRMVIVVATDIRDRLFMFDMLREGVPYAQLVDLELDQLMAHPEYMHATRGALLVGSDRTTSAYVPRMSADAGDRVDEVDLDEADEDAQRANMWRQANSYVFSSTDYQVLLRRIVQGIDASGPVTRSACTGMPGTRFLEVEPGRPILHVVGRQRVVALDCLRNDSRVLTSWVSPVLGLLAILLLAVATPAVQSLLGHPAWLARERQSALARLRQRYPEWNPSALMHDLRRRVPVDDPAINATLPVLVAGFVLLLASAYLGGGKSTFIITVLAAPPLCWALAYQAAFHRRNSLRPRPLRWNEFLGTRLSRHLLAVLALLLLALIAAWWIGQELKRDPVTITTIARFAYRADQGLAIGTAMTMAILGLVFADNTLAVARNASERNQLVALGGFWPRTEHGRIRCHLRVMFNVSLIPRSAVMAVGMLVLFVCVAMALPLKVSLFGEFLSVLALVAVTALGLLALSFLANALRLRRRALYLAGIVLSYARMRQGPPAPGQGEGCSIGLWHAGEAGHVRFAATPAAARLKDAGGEDVLQLLGPRSWLRFAEDLAHLRTDLRPIGERTRVALYVLFASEISQMRWATFSSAACSLAVVAFVYLYPVSGANGFVLFAVGLLMVNGLFAGLTAMSFEKNETMSNILCNRTSKAEFSGTLFNYIAFPFVILAVCLAIVQVPGVLDWSEGLFQSALNVARGRTLESVF